MGKVHWYNKSPSYTYFSYEEPGFNGVWGKKLLTSRCSDTDIEWKRHGPTKIKKANVFRRRNNLSTPEVEKKIKRRKNSHQNKYTKTSLSKYHEGEGEKKRSTAPEESSSGVCSMKSQTLNASKPNGGNRYREQSPRGLCPQKPERMEHPTSS